MSTYNGGNMDSAPEYSHGYGPGGPSHSGHRHGAGYASSSYRQGPHQGQSKREKELIQHGEAASYDILPPPSEAQTAFDHHANQHKAGYSKDRGMSDYFYKKPDPSYSGTYGTDYQPEISKTKVLTATAVVAALFYGVSRYRTKQKEKEKRKRHGKYPHAHGHHGHRGPDEYRATESEYHYDDSHS
ncbi:hypothetical protein H4S03_003621, partial [Coemansia sp. S3946]